MTDDQEQELDEIIAQYLQAQEGDETISAEDVIAAHPKFADQLKEFFDDMGQMDALARPMIQPDDSQPPVLDTIRYFGDYELLEEIARGGMGVVYKAQQVTLKRTVAVKMILSGTLASAADVDRFHTEAESAAKLDHPGIVPIYEVGEHNGQHYFSMGYVEGQSLSELIRDKLPTPMQAAAYLRSIATAVQYAHEQGVLHRDLKPSNVLVSKDGTIRLTDFGLARRTEETSSLTATGQVLGTPSYMPPEQARGDQSHVGSCSDVYALGAILYETLTGRPPFRAENAYETLRQVIEEEPVPPRLLNASVPAELETICLKCLEKQPDQRYSSAGLLADDLERFLNNEPIIARPPSVPGLVRSWIRKRISRIAWSVIVGAICGLLMALPVLCSVVFEIMRNAAQTYEKLFPSEQFNLPFNPPVISSWLLRLIDLLAYVAMMTMGYFTVRLIKPANRGEDMLAGAFTGLISGLSTYLGGIGLATTIGLSIAVTVSDLDKISRSKSSAELAEIYPDLEQRSLETQRFVLYPKIISDAVGGLVRSQFYGLLVSFGIFGLLATSQCLIAGPMIRSRPTGLRSFLSYLEISIPAAMTAHIMIAISPLGRGMILSHDGLLSSNHQDTHFPFALFGRVFAYQVEANSIIYSPIFLLSVLMLISTNGDRNLSWKKRVLYYITFVASFFYPLFTGSTPFSVSSIALGILLCASLPAVAIWIAGLTAQTICFFSLLFVLAYGLMGAPAIVACMLSLLLTPMGLHWFRKQGWFVPNNA